MIEPPPSTPLDRRNARRTWHLRTNAVVLLYLAAALAALLLYDALRVPRWLVAHLVMLGAITNAIVTWSEHFAVTLLRARPPSRRWSAVRLAGLNIAVIAILVGVTAAAPGLTVAAAALLAAVIVAHLASLAAISRHALMGRFAGTVSFYLAAGGWLVIGITIGALMVRGDFADSHAQLHAAHVHANVFGWVALSVLGTLFTLWPTVLRTRMVDGVMAAARQSLWLLTIGLALSVAGFAADATWLAAVGLAAYGGGVALALKPFVLTWRRKAPRDAAGMFLAAGAAWLVVGVTADIALVVRAADITSYAARLDALVPALVVGFALQTLIGALTYLMPVIRGGGPTAMRATIARLQIGSRSRVTALNAGIMIVAVDGLVGLPRALTAFGWLLVSASLAGFIWFIVAAWLPDADRLPATVAVLLGLVAAGLPVGLALKAHREHPLVVDTRAGEAREVAITAVDMEFQPAVIEAAAGTRLRLIVTNLDGSAHNLVFGTGAATPLLTRGQQATIDFGVVSHSMSGWCAVPGHRAAGMTLDIRMTGGH